MHDAAPDGLDAVGIGVPSIVEFETGRVISSVNVPLADIPLREVLGERFGVPVFVDNDATVAALAEAHDEQLQLIARNLVILTVGTGIGGGMVIGGRIYRGATGGAGEIGHTLVGLDLTRSVPRAASRSRSPGRSSASHRGTRSTGWRLEAAEREPDSELGRLHAPASQVLGAEAVAAAHDGDPVAARVVESGPSVSASASPTRSTRSTRTR